MRSLERHRKTVREVRDALETPPQAEPVEHIASAELATKPIEHVHQNREHRLRNYKEMQALLARVSTQGQAAAALGLSLRTIQRWVASGTFQSANTGTFDLKHYEFVARRSHADGGRFPHRRILQTQRQSDTT